MTVKELMARLDWCDPDPEAEVRIPSPTGGTYSPVSVDKEDDGTVYIS